MFICNSSITCNVDVENLWISDTPSLLPTMFFYAKNGLFYFIHTFLTGGRGPNSFCSSFCMEISRDLKKLSNFYMGNTYIRNIFMIDQNVKKCVLESVLRVKKILCVCLQSLIHKLFLIFKRFRTFLSIFGDEIFAK